MVLDDFLIEDAAVMASEGVSECMDRSKLQASVGIVLYDSKPQSVLCRETAELITESALPNCHVTSQNRHHRRAEGNTLNSPILCVPENDLSAAQIYILILNVTHCGSPAAAVQQDIRCDPSPILAGLAISFRPLQEREKRLICVSFLYSFGRLAAFETGICVALFIAPRKHFRVRV